MEAQTKAPAAYVIWDHDNAVLQEATGFYATLDEKLNSPSWSDLQKLLKGKTPPKGIAKKDWDSVLAAHSGFQAGCDILSILPFLAEKCNFFQLKVNNDLSINIPVKLEEKELQDTMMKVLVPPPKASSDEILSASGGMFYSREAPGMDKFVEEGDHFNQGDPLYIVEVMKMFNKVYAPFAGTIEKVLIEDDGVIIKKGQPLFKITPDETIEVEAPEDIKARKQKYTSDFLNRQ